ncbi:FxsA family protein [Aurantimonas sp. 22II-16-19i]|uniref:FxsA family protein n=1 Tax=Aurantimonas sp. 22II-16-19i TaxID=1317114 RepID=UPI0009F7A608|nr:FxsA family protein [Aurantimonas sp. 22II-16-19i]ORE91602.1 exclusion suppressor FxsA [Aurantimonas sp. 22II-16-19i]
MPFAIIPFLLLIIPVMEIAVFIAVGNLIGLWPTLALVVLTAVIGSVLLRRQGIGTLARIQAEMNAGRVPARELVDGVMILAAGILLLTPGLVTDTIGFLLFVPGVRGTIRRVISQRVVVMAKGTTSRGFGAGPAGPQRPQGPRRGGPDVVDLSGEDYHRRPDPSSPWRGDEGDGGPGDRTLH